MSYFGWYNAAHYHSGIGYVTPEKKHTGQADVILKQRKKPLTAAGKNRIGFLAVTTVNRRRFVVFCSHF